MLSATVREPARDVPVLGEFDVVVLGGGPAGICAALAAARKGRSTVLVERYGFLGGAGTASGLSGFCGLYANFHGEHRQVVHGLADEILERLKRMEGIEQTPHLGLKSLILAQTYDMSAYKIVADDMLLAAGVKLLLHAMGVGVAMKSPGEIEAVFVESKSGRAALRGRLFIDCSGDADLAAWSGAPWVYGNGRGNTIYPSTKFRLNNVDPEKAKDARHVIPKAMEEAERKGRRFPRRGAIVRQQMNPIEWSANATCLRNPDGTAISGIDVEQLTYGEVDGRRQSWEMYQFIRDNVPGFENAYIVDIAPQVGIRESRLVTGEYALSESDILGCASFEDTVGVNCWPVEAHESEGLVVKFPKIPESRGFNQMPYRMLVPLAVDNLLVAGRCASMTLDGQSSSRVTGPCFVMGQAAGTAADLALRRSCAPRRLDVPRLQEALEADGVYLGREE